MRRGVAAIATLLRRRKGYQFSAFWVPSCRRLTVGSAAPPQSGFVRPARWAPTAAGRCACLLMAALEPGQPGTQYRCRGRTGCRCRGKLTGSCSRSSPNCRRVSRGTSPNSVLVDPRHCRRYSGHTTSRNTTPTRSHSCHINPSGSAASHPPRGSSPHYCLRTRHTYVVPCSPGRPHN